jgi:hypothetical protein
MARVLADERSREHPARQEIQTVLLERLQEANADLGGVGDLAQADGAKLPFPAKAVTE